MNFFNNYSIKDLRPADYNPRRIDDEAFSKLIESIKTLGVIKPILLNANGTLIAGHQRVKALLALHRETVPAIVLPQVALKDEARLNLFHNSVETNNAEGIQEKWADVKSGYYILDSLNITTSHRGDAKVFKEICRLIAKYGNWGSVVVSQATGRIIFNSDYAAACSLLNKSMLAYGIAPEHEELALKMLSGDYGKYVFDDLQFHNLNQTKCQMHRLRDGAKGKQNRSTCYERIVLPNVTKAQRGVDFGEGYGDYRRKLAKDGYNIFGYEPFRRTDGANQIAVETIIASIKRLTQEIENDGLFDYVVLDSVLNSITSLDYERYVLATCNALLKPSGTLYLATRKIPDSQYKVAEFSRNKSREIEFIDDNQFSAIYREGMWTAQRFHTPETLNTLLEDYFETVELPSNLFTANQLVAVAKRKKRLSADVYKTALTEEFNPDYNGFRHNRHGKLFISLLAANDSLQ